LEFLILRLQRRLLPPRVSQQALIPGHLLRRPCFRVDRLCHLNLCSLAGRRPLAISKPLHPCQATTRRSAAQFRCAAVFFLSAAARAASWPAKLSTDLPKGHFAP